MQGGGIQMCAFRGQAGRGKAKEAPAEGTALMGALCILVRGSAGAELEPRGPRRSGRHLPEKLLAEVEAATLPQNMHTYRKARKSKQAVDAYLRAGTMGGGG